VRPFERSDRALQFLRVGERNSYERKTTSAQRSLRRVTDFSLYVSGFTQVRHPAGAREHLLSQVKALSDRDRWIATMRR
jgi:hypothetical protein